MSLPRFFLTDQIIGMQSSEVFELQLDADDARHAAVLRLAPGEHIAVIDASKDYFECEIVDVSGALPLVHIACHEERSPRRVQLTLVQGLAKADKMELVIRHATELGVASFIPLVCDRSIVKLDPKKARSKTERWRSIAKSAAMQSGQPFIPQVAEPQDIPAVCKALSECDCVLICWEEAPTTERIADALAVCTVAADRPCRIAVVIGPEGGLTDFEVETLLSCGAPSARVSLGPSILRTETAGIVAPALVLHQFGELG